MVIVWIDTVMGFTDTMNRPSPKKDVKIRPMITSTFSPERPDRKSIAPAARPPAMKAPKAKGLRSKR